MRIANIFPISFIVLVSIGLPSFPVIEDEKAALAVRQTIDSLGKLEVKAYDPIIPSAVRPLLVILKHQLRDLILAKLNDQAVRWNSANEVASQVLSGLKKVGVIVGKSEKETKTWEEEKSASYFYNDIREISIEAPPNHPDLIIAKTTLWVMCGEDTSFYLFKQSKGIWQLILAREASVFEDISGAQAHLGYALSPSDRNGDFFVVTADVNPWCTSNWQRLRYAVFFPGRDPYRPKVLLKKSDTIYLGIDPPIYTLQATQYGFRIEFYGDWYWNPDLGASRQFADYRVNRHRASLIKRGKIRNSIRQR